jgi:hypothetical protein
VIFCPLDQVPNRFPGAPARGSNSALAYSLTVKTQYFPILDHLTTLLKMIHASWRAESFYRGESLKGRMDLFHAAGGAL